ncbi:Uncharacterized protein SCF082_LOCUS23560 [Durusdinium trenchii]|uniref:Uncharacterized protein n=1 Tax=Durusdinium trenchii TaxID=1381693 RepID=A0ABP0LMU6_9DINO
MADWSEEDAVFLMDNLEKLNWQEVSLLLNEVQHQDQVEDTGQPQGFWNGVADGTWSGEFTAGDANGANTMVNTSTAAVNKKRHASVDIVESLGLGSQSAEETKRGLSLSSDARETADTRAHPARGDAFYEGELLSTFGEVQPPMAPPAPHYQAGHDIMYADQGLPQHDPYGVPLDEARSQQFRHDHNHNLNPHFGNHHHHNLAQMAGGAPMAMYGSSSSSRNCVTAAMVAPGRRINGGTATVRANGFDAEVRSDPAPAGSVPFEEIHAMLADALKGVYDRNVTKRFGVSPVNPKGPRLFYIVDRKENKEVDNLHREEDQSRTFAVRLRSTKKHTWFAPTFTEGLQFRELAKKERKSGNMLQFGGCIYTLVRRDPATGKAVVPSSTQILQVWDLPENPDGPVSPNSPGEDEDSVNAATSPAGTANVEPFSAAPVPQEARDSSTSMLTPSTRKVARDSLKAHSPRSTGTDDDETPGLAEACIKSEASGPAKVRIKSEAPKLGEMDNIKSESSESRSSSVSGPPGAIGSSDEVQEVVHEIFNRHCEALKPEQWVKWTEKYSRFLKSDNFAKALRLYVTQDDPRLKEDFLFPGNLEPDLPLGVFRATIDTDISAHGGTCTFADDTFKQMVEMDPQGMKGFFVSVLSPLQRLCIARVWWRRFAAEGCKKPEAYFAVWRVTQASYTLHNGKVKVLRTNNRIVKDESGRQVIECQSQDVTHLYPEIPNMPRFLA